MANYGNDADDEEVSSEPSSVFIGAEEHQVSNPNIQREFTVAIFGHRISTTVTRRARIVRQWVYSIRNMNRYKAGNQSLVVGLGVQWRPPTSNKVATLQLCVGSRCLIFQICRANSIPMVLRRFLDNENGNGGATFVGVNNHVDGQMLRRDYKLDVKPLLELGGVAGYKGYSMERLADLILGFNGVGKSERVGRSDWDQREMIGEQVQYACVDAFISFEIGRRLRAWRRV